MAEEVVRPSSEIQMSMAESNLIERLRNIFTKLYDISSELYESSSDILNLRFEMLKQRAERIVKQRQEYVDMLREGYMYFLRIGIGLQNRYAYLEVFRALRTIDDLLLTIALTMDTIGRDRIALDEGTSMKIQRLIEYFRQGLELLRNVCDFIMVGSSKAAELSENIMKFEDRAITMLKELAMTQNIIIKDFAKSLYNLVKTLTLIAEHFYWLSSHR